MERIIDVTTARQNLGTLLDEVFYKGDIIILERKGKALAKIVPLGTEENFTVEKPRVSVEKQKLLDDLNSLPIISGGKNSAEELRSLRQIKGKRARQLYG